VASDVITVANTASIEGQLRSIHDVLRVELPPISRVAVAIYDEQSDILKTFVHSTDGEAPFSHYEAKLEQVPSLRDLARRHSSRVIDELRLGENGDARSEHIRRLVQSGYRSTYTLPFYDHDAFFGFLFFDSMEPGYFSPQVVRHLSVYAHLISLLIINEVSRVAALRSAILVARKMSHTHNEETGAHLDRMARYSRLIAKALADTDADINDEFVEFVFLYAPLHDVGKIAVPDHILLKPSRLSPAEHAIMKTHVSAGMEIVESIASSFHVGSGQHVDVLRNIVRFHHEAFDGSGYLSGRSGDDIPLEARIVAVADVFDALTTVRCYKTAWTNEAAYRLLRDLAGRQFDPHCVEALLASPDKVLAIQGQFASDNTFHEGYTAEL
jgi:HD-GYP domain-containing protein (c-di-GMP phosphodiesterase class II)